MFFFGGVSQIGQDASTTWLTQWIRMFFFVAALKKQSHQSSHAGNLPKQYFFCLAWKMEQILEHRKSISIVMEQQILENLGVARSLRKKSIRNPNWFLLRT